MSLDHIVEFNILDKCISDSILVKLELVSFEQGYIVGEVLSIKKSKIHIRGLKVIGSSISERVDNKVGVNFSRE
jgi:hypothetical protein